jgi:hypothetical protein
MRRGEFSLIELLAWARRAPHEVPTLNGEFEFLAWHLADNEDESPTRPAPPARTIRPDRARARSADGK